MCIRDRRRSDLTVTAVPPRQLLELLLEFQPGQLAPLCPQMLEIRKPHLGHQTGIGENGVPAAGRHTVHHRFGRIGHRRNDESPGAHTERIEMCIRDSSYIVDSHSRTIREEAPVKYPKHKQIRFGSRFFLYRFLCPRNTIYNAGMALVRRSALPAGDNYTQYRYCGDWLFWIQIVSGGGKCRLSCRTPQLLPGT